MTTKIREALELFQAREGSDAGSRLTVGRALDELALLEADNAALLAGLRRVTWQCRDQDHKEHEAADQLADQPHPGTAMLERVRRLEAVVRELAPSRHTGHDQPIDACSIETCVLIREALKP